MRQELRQRSTKIPIFQASWSKPINGGVHRTKKHLSGTTQCPLLEIRLTTVLGAALCSFQSLEKAHVLPLSSDTECGITWHWRGWREPRRRQETDPAAVDRRPTCWESRPTDTMTQTTYWTTSHRKQTQQTYGVTGNRVKKTCQISHKVTHIHNFIANLPLNLVPG